LRVEADLNSMSHSRRWLGLACCLALPILAAPVYAQQCSPPATIAGDRPGPSIVPAGSLQVESGVGYTTSAGGSMAAAGATLVRIGVSCRVEARAATSGWMRASSGGPGVAGIGDAWLGSKIGVLSGGGLIPQLSILTGTVIPLHSVHSHRALEPEANLAASWSLPRGQSLVAFSGVSQRAEGTARAAEQLQGVSWWVPIRGLVPFVEYSQISRANSMNRMIGTGLTVFPFATLQLDGSVIVPIGPGASGAMLGLGLSRRW
jgi:hypothetical protein